ncbi:MAG: hypothetical protein ABEJ99_04805 [Candidatus Nanohaloarchaea archaeon]
MTKARLRTAFGPSKTDVQQRIYQNSHIKLGRVLEEGTVDELVAKAERFIEDEKSVQIKEDGHLLRDSLVSTDFDFAQNFSEAFKAVEGNRELLQGYYGSYFKPAYGSLYRNYHVPSDELDFHGYRWHFDSFTPDHIRIFIMLSDPEEAGAPLHLLDRPQSKQVARKQQTGALHLDDYDTDEIKISKGEAILTNTTQILHRGGNPPENSKREMIQLTFAPASRPMENDPEKIRFAAEKETDVMGLKRFVKY